MSQNNYQTKINLVYNIITFIINALIGLVLPIFLIKKLGISTYSLIPLSMSITSFMVLVTISINGTLSRFLSIDFENDTKDVNKTFSTSFFLLIGLFVLLAPITIFFLLNPNFFLTIENQDLKDAKILFLFTVVSFILNSFASLYSSIPFVKNRIDIRNISLIINRLGIVIFIVGLFLLGYINVQSYGIAVFFATILSFLYSIKTARQIFPELSIKLEYFNKVQLYKISKLGFWLIVNQIGVVLFLQADIIVVNKILGAKQSGVYGTLVQWSFLVRTIVGMIAGILGPIVLSLYAKNKIEELVNLTKFSTKILGIFGAIVAFVIVYFSRDILVLWLGKDFEIYYKVLILIIFHLGFNTGYSSIINLNIAYNKAKIPGVVTIITGLLNIGLGVIFLKFTDLGLLGIGISGFICLTIKNLIFTPLYLSYIMNLKPMTFITPIFPSIVISLLSISMIFIFPSSSLHIAGYFSLAMWGAVFTFIISAFSWLVFFNKSEKMQLTQLIFAKIKK